MSSLALTSGWYYICTSYCTPDKYSERILERSEASASFVELAWMFKEQRQSWNLLESESFDVNKNSTVLIIVVLGHSEIDMKVSDTGMKIIESNDYKGVSGDDRDANGVLAVTWEGATFFHKDE